MVVVKIGTQQESVQNGHLVVFVGGVAVGVHGQQGDDIITGGQLAELLPDVVDSGGQGALIGFQIQQAFLYRWGEYALLDGRHDIFNAAAGLGQRGGQVVQLGTAQLFDLPRYYGIGQGGDGLVVEDIALYGLSDGLLDVVLGHGFTAAQLRPLPLACVIVVAVSVAAAAAGNAHHGRFAVTAVEFTGQQINVLLAPSAARLTLYGARIGFNSKGGLHGIKQLSAYDGRYAILDADVAVDVHARVFFVAQGFVDQISPPRFALSCPETASLQIMHDLHDGLTVIGAGENLPYNGGLRLVDGIFAILIDVPRRQRPVDHAPPGIVSHASGGFLRQLTGIVFGHALQHGFQQHACGIVGQMLHGGQHSDPVIFEFTLVNRAVIAVTSETIQRIDNDILPLPRRRIPYHSLKSRSLVAGAGQSPVIVHAHDLQRLPVRKITAGTQLLVNGHITLGIAGVSCINYSFLHSAALNT